MNWNKAYILIIDKGGWLSGFNAEEFHKGIIRANGVKTWWHYIDNTYILIVEWGVTAKDITDYAMKLIPNRKFFVCELNINNHNGWLPQDAWDWINKQKIR